MGVKGAGNWRRGLEGWWFPKTWSQRVLNEENPQEVGNKSDRKDGPRASERMLTCPSKIQHFTYSVECHSKKHRHACWEILPLSKWKDINWSQRNKPRDTVSLALWWTLNMKDVHALQSCLPYFSGNKMAKPRELLSFLVPSQGDWFPQWVVEPRRLRSLFHEIIPQWFFSPTHYLRISLSLV